MKKIFSRRFLICASVFCFAFAGLVLGVSKPAQGGAFFSSSQQWNIFASFSSDLSQLVEYNYNTGLLFFYPATFGSYSVSWTLPLGADRAYILYDWTQGRYSEVVYILDRGL